MEHEHENHTHHEGHADTFPTETEGLLQAAAPEIVELVTAVSKSDPSLRVLD